MPLEGLKVIDWTTAVAAPMTGRMLADLGAEVIKIEPLEGEMFRQYGLSYDIPIEDDYNPMYTNENSNKKFLALNVKHDAGKKTFWKLLENADVFLTNIRYRSLEKLGLDYDSVKNRYPKLIFAHFNGYGYEGADAERPGYDLAAFWARSGGLGDWTAEEHPPVNPSVGAGDITSATMIYSGILSALYARERTGKGTLVSTSLYANGIWVNGNTVLACQKKFGFQMPERLNRKPNPFTGSTYLCKDGNWVAVMITPYDRYWTTCCRIFELEEYLQDPRFSTHKELLRGNNRAILRDVLEKKMKQKTSEEWMEIFKSNDVAAEFIKKIEDVAEDPQAWRNNYVEQVSFPNGQEATFPVVPLQFSEYTIKKIGPSQALGCDTTDILTAIGFDTDTIDQMRQEKVIL